MAKTILLADDSITIQKIVNLTFSGEGIEVVTVGNGDAAIKKVYDLRPDLVLADIFMPGKNGYEVCEYIKSENDLQHIPVILLVGAFEPFDSNEASRVKADGHLTKPFEIRVLISAVNSLINAAQDDNLKTADLKEASPELENSGASTVEDSSVEVDSGAAIPMTPDQETSISFAPGSGRDTSSPRTFLAEGFPSVVNANIDVGPVSRETKELEVPVLFTSPSMEDLDPLGLYSGEPISAEKLQGTDAPVDPKELVVDIWESRSVSSSKVESHPEVKGPDEMVAPALAIPSPRNAGLDLAGIENSIRVEGIDQRQGSPSVAEAAASSATYVDLVSVPPGEIVPAGFSSERIGEKELVDSVVRKVMEKLSKDVIERIAWEVVPDLAEVIIKEQIELHLKTSGRI
jgi:CheY-like chemotaxis protein